ncbi:MAG: formylglycine-generating enzyme family protein, partial [Kiritimatiellae bacterium]|nr:formylglycine-generating enzyme family protein [Kiritimatiellia bacterium]
PYTTLFRSVDIDYVLTCDPGQLMDITVEAYDGSTPVTLPLGSLAGDLYYVKRGARRIVWDPTKTTYANSGILPEFRVKLTPSVSVVEYMVVDLSGGTNAASYTVSAYTNEVPGGVTDDRYKTTSLLLRRVPAGTFMMGDESTLGASFSVTLTKDFYAGVHQVTQEQWYRVMGTKPSKLKDNPSYPVDQVSYNEIRGTAAGAGWPASTAVDETSFIGTLRIKTGLSGFDLPTEAQWEYACRAGTATYYNDGLSGSSDDQLKVLGWYTGNSGGRAHSVGQKTPNTWGLYDMHGNVWEWCLDWYVDPLVSGYDPKGAESGSTRVMRGGSWSGPAAGCRSAYRNRGMPQAFAHNIGFRLLKILP